MSLLSLIRVGAGQVSVQPGDVRMIATDNLDAITTANYLQNTVNSPAKLIGLAPSDVIECLYSYNVSSGTGTLAYLQPSISNGVITLVDWVNPNNVVLPVVAGNLPMFDSTTGILEDSLIPSTQVPVYPFASTDPALDLIRFDVTCGEAALASAGKVNLITSATGHQYKIINLWANLGGTNFSGGSGNRLLAISDGTTVFSLIPAADLQTLVNSGWGQTALPFPASAAINVSTAASANLFAQYSGGSADYTAGSIVISGIAQRVA